MSNDEYLSYLREQTPHMTAVFHEALRYYSASSSIRFAVAPTPVGSKIVPANSVIFIPFRPLHFDGEVFGPDVDSFNPDRFIRNKKLASSQNFRPFSGGTSYCPGRTLARQEFAVFVTELLGKYDIEVLGGGDGMRMPQVDEKTPTKGIRIPKKGDDIRLKISRKKT
jgi:cytochrome P450